MKVEKEQMKEIKEFSKRLEVLYNTFNWRWCDSKNPPTVKEIEKHIIEMIKGLKKKTKSISCGGITIEKEESGQYRIEWRLTEQIWLNL